MSNPFLTRRRDTLGEICADIDTTISNIEWTSTIVPVPYLKLSGGVYRGLDGRVTHNCRIGPSGPEKIPGELNLVMQYSSGKYYLNKTLFTRSYRGYADRLKSVVDYDQLAVL